MSDLLEDFGDFVGDPILGLLILTDDEVTNKPEACLICGGLQAAPDVLYSETCHCPHGGEG